MFRLKNHFSLIQFGLMGVVLLLLTAYAQIDAGTAGILAARQHNQDICSIAPTSSANSFIFLLTTGLITGLSHCAGMCGPLVSAFVIRRRANKKETTSPLVIYQMGRLTTYTLFGILLGGIGFIVRFALVERSWQGILSILIGSIMLLMGLNLWGILPWSRALESAGVARQVGKWMRRLMLADHPAAPFGLGMANGLLPCGAVYAIALLALTAGSMWRGAMIMLIFGLGTLPAMLGIGLFASKLSHKLRGNLYRVAATMILLAGFQLTLRGLALNGVVNHAVVSGIVFW